MCIYFFVCYLCQKVTYFVRADQCSSQHVIPRESMHDFILMCVDFILPLNAHMCDSQLQRKEKKKKTLEINGLCQLLLIVIDNLCNV